MKLNTTDSQWASPSWYQAPIWTREQFFFLLEIIFRQLRVCYFVAPSLKRGRVCNLLLLLVLASAVPLGSESCGTQDHILLSQFFRLPQPERQSPRIYIPQERSGMGYILVRHHLSILFIRKLWYYRCPTVKLFCYNISYLRYVNVYVERENG
jgi:hypothetical protein